MSLPFESFILKLNSSSVSVVRYFVMDYNIISKRFRNLFNLVWVKHLKHKSKFDRNEYILF